MNTENKQEYTKPEVVVIQINTEDIMNVSLGDKLPFEDNLMNP